MKTDDILDQYSLSRDTALKYIDTIIRLNQTQTAEELDVSRDTVNRYKTAFANMTPEERSFLITALFQEQTLELGRSNLD